MCAPTKLFSLGSMPEFKAATSVEPSVGTGEGASVAYDGDNSNGDKTGSQISSDGTGGAVLKTLVDGTNIEDDEEVGQTEVQTPGLLAVHPQYASTSKVFNKPLRVLQYSFVLYDLTASMHVLPSNPGMTRSAALESSQSVPAQRLQPFHCLTMRPQSAMEKMTRTKSVKIKAPAQPFESWFLSLLFSDSSGSTSTTEVAGDDGVDDEGGFGIVMFLQGKLVGVE